jgi:hypothetical protein
VLEDLYKKYDSILSQEEARARRVSYTVNKSKPISVWEVMVPFIFISSYMKMKQVREIFAQNLIFTRKLALDGALEIRKSGKTREQIMASVAEKTEKLLTDDTLEIYSDSIRQAQHDEVEYLIDHYGKLLDAQGTDYASMVRNAYETKDALLRFQERLKQSKERVTKEALESLGDKADPDLLERIETVLQRERTAELEKVFGSPART